MPNRNDEPKISPGAMKAANALVAEQVRVAQGERDYIGYGEYAEIIDTATNLTDKEEALRGCMEVLPGLLKLANNYRRCVVGGEQHKPLIAKSDAVLATIKKALKP